MLVLWWTAAVGSCACLLGRIGLRRFRGRGSDQRIPISEYRAFVRALAHTDDLVGRLRTEPRRIP